MPAQRFAALALAWSAVSGACSDGVLPTWWERQRAEVRACLAQDGARQTSEGRQRSDDWVLSESWELEVARDWTDFCERVGECLAPSFRQVQLDDERLVLVRELEGDVLRLQLLRLQEVGGTLRARITWSGAAR